MDWTDIEAKLAEKAEDVCRHLLPNGHRDGAEWVCGNLEGQAGDSLKINLGAKAGVWRDFASNKGGKTLISLWCSVRSRPFKDCIVEAKAFLGIRDDFERRIRSYPKPNDPAARDLERSTYRNVAENWKKLAPLNEAGPVWRYLTETRHLAPAMLRLYDVREFADRGYWVMVFPYHPSADDSEATRAGVAAAVLGEEQTPAWLKFECLDRVDGKKREWTTTAPEKCLYGMQLADRPEFKDARHLLICEGEKDAITWASFGCATWNVLPVSVPFGAKWKGTEKGRPSPNREWLDRAWDWMQRFETIFVAMDSDEAGRRAAADIIAEIGPRRCRLVELPKDAQSKPYKDANDCLLAGIPAEEMRYVVENAVDFAPKKVVPAADFREAFMAEWFDKQLEPGLEVPWNFPQFKIRPAELTVWTGIEKSGKTTLLSFLLIALMSQGERAMIASFEVMPPKTLKKLSRQASGTILFGDKDVLKHCKTYEDRQGYEASARVAAIETFEWLAKNLWLYNHTGIGRWRELGDDIRFARRRYGITQYAIDNFMRLGIAKDDYAQQADAITFFTSLAMELDVHIHLVVHQNKSEGQRGASGKRTVSGAYEIIANAHNIVEVQRDEKKGEQVSDLFDELAVGKIGQADFNKRKAELDSKPDGKFILHAQRDGEQQNGSKYLWFLWKGQQYCDKPPSHEAYGPLQFVADAKKRPKQTTLPTNDEMKIPKGKPL